MMLMIKNVLAAAMLAGAQTAAPAASVEDLSWLAGYWLDCTGGREASEVWSDPRAGLIAGLAVTVRGGRSGFEASQIRAAPDGGLAYFAQPDGAAPTVFALVESGPGRAVFSNPQNDFPHRIIYQRDGDVLAARIEGEINGQARSAQWRFDRAELNTRCPG